MSELKEELEKRYLRDENKIIRLQQERIAELEKERDALKAERFANTAGDLSFEDSPDMNKKVTLFTDSDIEALKLEQQAKGVEDFKNKYELCEPHNWYFRAEDYTKKLKQKAEQMK